MELAWQVISIYGNVRSNAVQDLKDFNALFLATAARKGKQLVAMMPAIKKAFNLMGDGIVDLSRENKILKKK